MNILAFGFGEFCFVAFIVVVAILFLLMGLLFLGLPKLDEFKSKRDRNYE